MLITVNAAGTRTLKDAINEALRDWVTNVHDTYYLWSGALGPHPYPWLMVAISQDIIGREAREQILSTTTGLRRALVACVWRIECDQLFHPFIGDEGVRLIGCRGWRLR